MKLVVLSLGYLRSLRHQDPGAAAAISVPLIATPLEPPPTAPKLDLFMSVGGIQYMLLYNAGGHLLPSMTRTRSSIYTI